MPKNSSDIFNALAVANAGEFYQLLQKSNPNLTDEWVLLTTEGCHLCQEIKTDLSMVGKVYSIPKVIEIDIINLDTPILNALATHIPILLTNKSLLHYPFGVMDTAMLLLD